MVKYITEPKKRKKCDPVPMYFNCTPDTIKLTAAEADPGQNRHTFADLVELARKMGMEDRELADVHEIMARIVRKKDAWMIHHAVESLNRGSTLITPGFLPPEKNGGKLDTALPFQTAACRWIERGSAKAVHGLWIKTSKGAGKTLLKKLFQLRYTDQVYTAVRCGPSGCYDITSFTKYKREPIIFMNAIKPANKRLEGIVDGWSASLLELLKSLTGEVQSTTKMGNQVHCLTVVAKVIVVSDVGRPATKDIENRFDELSFCPKTGQCEFKENEGETSAPSNVKVTLADGLAPATEFALPDNLAAIDLTSEELLIERLAALRSQYPALQCGGWERTPRLPEGAGAMWAACIDKFEESCGFVYWLQQEVFAQCNKNGVRLSSLDHACDILFKHHPDFQTAVQTEGDAMHWAACLEAAFPRMIASSQRHAGKSTAASASQCSTATPKSTTGRCTGASTSQCSAASSQDVPAAFTMQSD